MSFSPVTDQRISKETEVYIKKYSFLKDYNVNEYNINDFELIEVINESGYGITYRAYNRIKKLQYFIKLFRITEERETKIQKEISILYTLNKVSNCELIIKLCGTKIFEIEKELGIDIEPGDSERKIILILESGDANL